MQEVKDDKLEQNVFKVFNIVTRMKEKESTNSKIGKVIVLLL